MKSKTRSRSAVALLLIIAAASLPFFIGNASAPGITEVDKTYTPVTLSPAAQDPIEANLAGGVIDFVMTEDQCGTTTLRIVTDTDRIDKILGNPAPSAGYVVLTQQGANLFNPITQTCDIPNSRYSA